ncbi:MAG: DUF4184 family protein [Chitinophagaceae bacterium]
MPFTFSHPAAILPFSYLWEKKFSATGLILGSVAPDFEYFMRFHNASYHSHTWAGIFWFDLPAGIILCFIFHDVVKTPFIMNLPGFFHKRFASYLSFNWKKYFIQHWFIVFYSLLIGILSHLLLDRFTHQSYRFFNAVPALKDSLEPGFHPNRLYRLIQVSYSLIGLGIIGWAVWKLPQDNGISYPLNTGPYWILLGFMATSILGIIILANGFEYVDWIIAVISSLLISLTATSFLMLTDKWVLIRGWR